MPLQKPSLDQHFQIEAGALLDALRFDQLAVLRNNSMRSRSSTLIVLDGAQRGVARRNVMAGRVNSEARHLGEDLPGERVEQVQRFHLVVEQSTRIAVSAFSAGKMSITSPRTRNVPRLNSISLRSYCISVSRLMTSRCPIFSPWRSSRIMPW